MRRADGQTIQLPQALYAIVEALDEGADLQTTADRVGEALQRKLDPDDVRFLIDEKLAPLGLIDDGSGATVAPKVDPLLGFKMKTALVPAHVVRRVTTVFRPLFHPLVVLVVLGGLVVLDVWLFGSHGVAQPVRETLEEPAFILLVIGLVVASAAFHEIGHATACAYGGATPGVMGAGLYLVWPAFYTDVTDSYRLGRGGRLRTDLGGIYFTIVFAELVALAAIVTGSKPLLLVVAIIHLEIVHQFLPFLRLDGYYVVSDLVGVPDLFARIKPILRSLAFWRPVDPSVRELKPWARAVVTIWVLTVVPLLLWIFGLMLASAPRILATGARSAARTWGESSAAFGDGNVLAGIAGVAQVLILALPLIAIPYTIARVGWRASRGAWRMTSGRPVARGGLLAVTTGLAVLLAISLAPGPRYRPIQPWERGTVQEGVAALRAMPSRELPASASADPAATTAPPAATEDAVTGTSPAPDETAVTTDPAGSPAPSPAPTTDASISPSPSPSPSPTPTGDTSPSPSPSPSV